MAFTHQEMSILLTTPRVGPRVIQRLQEVGIDSLPQLRQVGADDAVRLVCEHLGNTAWANRRHALRRALTALCAPVADTVPVARS